MATNPEMSFVQNHAATLGENTRACVVVELRKDGSAHISRYSERKRLEDYVLASYQLQRVVWGLFDNAEGSFQPPPPGPPTAVL